MKKKKSHVCPVCSYKCARRDHFTCHMRIHDHTTQRDSDQGLFECQVRGCLRIFNRKCHLFRHINSKHKTNLQDNNVDEQDTPGPSRLVPQTDFSTDADGPKTSGNKTNGTNLVSRRENSCRQREVAKAESEMQAAIQAKAVVEKLHATLLEQNAYYKDIAAAAQRKIVAEREKYRENVERYLKESDSMSLEEADSSNMDIKTKLEEQDRNICDLRNRLEGATHQLIKEVELQKERHNTLMDLKGNIRVFCRVRPPVPNDGVGDASIIAYPSSLEYQGRGIVLIQKGKEHTFAFDKVFSHEASQEDVFGEISELVQSAMDGYKVCIFSYGQTGSGKTYTMVGKSETLEQKGLIPRSMEQIFQTSQSLLAQSWKYKMQASMLEIHNETIYDLLSTSTEMGVQGKTYEIKQDENGNIFVSNLNVIDVDSVSEVLSLFRRAAQSRFVGENSSRSHFVSTLQISGVNEVTKQRVDGVLNLIDLAGSELLQETQGINKSLSSLGDVIFALAKKQRHVPFGKSKLTHLLQSCLGGDSKTLMFVNISPDIASVDESLCALRFAKRVHACKIGVPKRRSK